MVIVTQFALQVNVLFLERRMTRLFLFQLYSPGQLWPEKNGCPTYTAGYQIARSSHYEILDL